MRSARFSQGTSFQDVLRIRLRIMGSESAYSAMSLTVQMGIVHRFALGAAMLLQGPSGPARRQMSGARYEPSESDRDGVR
jgi:hypothetical protein